MQAHGGRWRDSALARIGVLACVLALQACTTTTTRSSGEVVSTTQKPDSATSAATMSARSAVAIASFTKSTLKRSALPARISMPSSS